MDELRPCVCGDASVSVICDKGDCGQSRFPWSVTCGNYDCDWEFGWFATREEAINKWNTRASDEVIRGLVDALERQSRCSEHLLKRIPARDYAETCGEAEQALAQARKHLQSEK